MAFDANTKAPFLYLGIIVQLQCKFIAVLTLKTAPVSICPSQLEISIFVLSPGKYKIHVLRRLGCQQVFQS